ncbi:MAG: ATP-binding cassette domain-containing protein [Candidatus Heimdallarchaeaceae archaeon]
MKENLGLKVVNLKKNFNGFQALKGVSIEIKKEGLYGLIGPNGAGKTTLFKCITGLLQPTEGQIFLNNIEVKPKNLDYRNLYGFLPEDSGLYDRLTAKEFLHIIAGMHGLPKDERKKRVQEVVEFVGIDYPPSKIIRYLSTGQRRLLLIASILLHDPCILILDESLNGLDPEKREHVSNLMKELAKTKVVFYSSHILSDIWRLCEKVYVLNKGELVIQDSPENIVSQITENKYFVSSRVEREKIMEVLKAESNITEVEEQGNKILFRAKTIENANNVVKKLLDEFEVTAFGNYEPELDGLFTRMVNMK